MLQLRRAAQIAQLRPGNPALVRHHGHQQADTAPGQLLLDITHRCCLGLSINPGMTVDAHFIGQEQPARTSRAHPRAGVVKHQPARATFQIRRLLRHASLGQLPGKPVRDLAMQHLLGGQVRRQHWHLGTEQQPERRDKTDDQKTGKYQAAKLADTGGKFRGYNRLGR